MAYVYVKNESDALDVVQETAYRSFKNITTLRNPKYFKTWLMKIAINCAINIVKQNSKVVQLKPAFDELIGSEEEDIPQTLSIQDLIDHLSEIEKSIVLLRFYQSHTFSEIAEILEIPLGTAKSILYRALKKLKSEFLKGDRMHE